MRFGGVGDTWEKKMVRTIVMGSYVSVQGQFVRALGDGRIVVSVGKQEFVGKPAAAA